MTIPVSLPTERLAYEARLIFGRTPGTSAVALDAAAGKATFGYEFPGNIDRLVERLAGKGIGPIGSVAVDVPVRNLTGLVIDATEMLAHLNASPLVSNAAYDGKTVSVTAAPTTSAMRYVLEEIVLAGLMPVDVPTVAGPQEFVL